MKCLAYVLLFACLLLPVPSRAQDDAQVDTLDWRGYYPMEIGNAWEYKFWESGGSDQTHYIRREIVGDTTLNDRSYYVQIESSFKPRTDNSTRRWGQAAYLRYDDSLQTVVAWDDEEAGDVLYIPYLCDLGAAFNSVICEELLFDGVRVTRAEPREGEASVSTIKTFSFPCCGGFYQFEHGRGPTRWELIGFIHDREVYYARVDSVEYGRSLYPQPLENLSGHSDSEIPLPVRLTISDLYPQPSAGAFTVSFVSREIGTVHIDIFDAAGRRLRQASSQMADLTGRIIVRIDGSSWSPGVYFLRLRNETGGEAIRAFVVAR